MQKKTQPGLVVTVAGGQKKITVPDPYRPLVVRPALPQVALQRKPAQPVGKPMPVVPALLSKPSVRRASPQLLAPAVVSVRGGLPIIQRAALKKKAPTISVEGLEADSFLYSKTASGGPAAELKGTVQTSAINILRVSDLENSKPLLVSIMDTLKNPKMYRNKESAQPVHGNHENRLPMYTPIKNMQPYPEYRCGKGGGRIVVDAVANRVYLSHHYGDGTIKAMAPASIGAPGSASAKKAQKSAQIMAKVGNTSAHVLLDPESWELKGLLTDAVSWWEEILSYTDFDDVATP